MDKARSSRNGLELKVVIAKNNGGYLMYSLIIGVIHVIIAARVEHKKSIYVRCNTINRTEDSYACTYSS